MAVLRNKKGFTRKRDWVQQTMEKIIEIFIDLFSSKKPILAIAGFFTIACGFLAIWDKNIILGIVALGITVCIIIVVLKTHFLAIRYQKGIKQKGFLKWEIDTLKKIYYDLDFVFEFDESFPAIVYEGSNRVTYPFTSLNKAENLYLIGQQIAYQTFPYYTEFRRIVYPTIHYPDLYGFTNSGLLFDEENKVIGFKSIPRKYNETVFSGHILHYELWKAFLKTRGKRLASLEDLPIRKAIHEGMTNKEVVISGCRRSSLCDICLAVIVYDKKEHGFNIAVATRSKNVACYPGYLSIVPSGGFELYELENKQSSYVIKKNFSIISAIFREYIEEIFGDTDFDGPTGDDDLRRLYRNVHIQEIQEKIGKTFFLEFLGVVFDMVSLRPTFSFILKVDDDEFLYNNQIKKNYENDDIRFINLKYFPNEVKENFHRNPLLCESAGVYSLLKGNHLFNDAINNKMSSVTSHSFL